MIGVHHLPESAYAVLPHTGESPRVLWRTRLSRHLLELRALRDAVRSLAPADGDRAGFETSYAVLGAAQRRQPDAVAELLIDPQIGLWLGWCLRRLWRTVHDEAPAWLDLAYLGAIAVVAAARVRIPASTLLPVRAGWINLPTLGRRWLEQGRQWDLHESSVQADSGDIKSATGQLIYSGIGRQDGLAGTWQGLHHAETSHRGYRLRVVLDDVQLYRQFSGPPAGRLDNHELSHWRRVLGAAWEILTERHPRWAAGIGELIRVLVPLSSSSSASVSLTVRDAVGLVALTRPPEPATLAATLIHELQHNRLNAIHDVTPLYSGTPETDLYSPWRDDPRPVQGLLHGMFAFCGVADFWRAESGADAPDRQIAVLEHVVVSQQVRLAYTTLAAVAGRLTPIGRQLVSEIETILQGWDRDEVDPEIVRIAQDLVDEHRILWRLRHLKHSSSFLADVASGWPTDLSVHWPELRASLAGAGPPLVESDRRRSARRWLRGARDIDPRADSGDGFMLLGEYSRAAERYASRVRRDMTDLNAWAGLAIALPRCNPEYEVIKTRPELIFGLCSLVGDTTDPRAVAAWLAGIDRGLHYSGGVSMS
jgi:HEXXH motif-containing protein